MHSDIDECEDEPPVCLSFDHEVCSDTLGSYVCECEEGYHNVSGLCEGTKTTVTICACAGQILVFIDVDECENNLHNCSYMCVNQNGSYSCTCDRGYSLQDDGETCQSKCHNLLSL